ncbi:GNAT family N-acetyltransferase [Blautia schinkii]|nr:GNAT family N-acetyltransferase [Blautia schinkii]
MPEEIILRQYRDEDAEALSHIIRRTWNYDQLCSAKTARRLARTYLYSCLTNQTFAVTAVADGKPAGIIMGKNIKTHRCPLKYRLRQITSIAALLSSKEGRSVTNIFKDVDTIDKNLLSQSGINYGGEVSFFAVSPDYRGKGIGKKLYQTLLHYMKTQNISDIYLFTDTTCNYRFYEHQHMNRRCSLSHPFKIGGKESPMTFFLFDRHLT